MASARAPPRVTVSREGNRNGRRKGRGIKIHLNAIFCCVMLLSMALFVAFEFGFLGLQGPLLGAGQTGQSTFFLGQDQFNRRVASKMKFTERNLSFRNMTNSPTALSPTTLLHVPTEYPSEAPSMLPTFTPTEYHIRERPAVDIPVYVAIASVPRFKNEKYLIKVIESLVWAQFPLDHVYVFFNGHRNETHFRWSEAFYLYSNMGVHFLWNEMPPPPIHPAVFNESIPLPANVSSNYDQEVQMAMTDDSTRKRWRHKECSDFRAISKHMLSVVALGRHDNGGDPANDPWVIFNQDDGQWIVFFRDIFPILMQEKNIVDFYGEGMVTIAFQTGFLSSLVDYGEVWCDFKPVDWMMWHFSRIRNATIATYDKSVKHIGKTSSRKGRVSDDPPPTVAPTQEEDLLESSSLSSISDNETAAEITPDRGEELREYKQKLDGPGQNENLNVVVVDDAEPDSSSANTNASELLPPPTEDIETVAGATQIREYLSRTRNVTNWNRSIEAHDNITSAKFLDEAPVPETIVEDLKEAMDEEKNKVMSDTLNKDPIRQIEGEVVILEDPKT